MAPQGIGNSGLITGKYHISVNLSKIINMTPSPASRVGQEYSVPGWRGVNVILWHLDQEA